MGAGQSKSIDSSKSFSDLEGTDALHQVAVKYILTQNFKDLKNLTSKEYCDQLIILTSDIIKKVMTEKEISYLSNTIIGGVPADIMENKKIMYLDTKNVKKMDVSNTKTKDRMCKGIAKFYIKIAHIYAAILKVVNPLFTYTDAYGNVHRYSIINKDKIPSTADVKISQINLCSRRINALQYSKVGENIKINQSKACNLNQKLTKTKISDDTLPSKWSGMDKLTKTLSDEIGIPELEKLYYDTYDYNTGKFISMSKKNKKIYEKNLESFYKTFTGEEKLSYKKWNKDKKRKFADIPLNDYSSSNLCLNEDSLWRKNYTGKKNMFEKYAQHLKTMMDSSEKNQKDILGYLDKLFCWIKKDDVDYLTICPGLNEKSLNALTDEIRDKIINLYFNCEKDFKEGLHIFEAVIADRILKNAQAKTETLGKQVSNLTGQDIDIPIPQN